MTHQLSIAISHRHAVISRHFIQGLYYKNGIIKTIFYSQPSQLNAHYVMPTLLLIYFYHLKTEY